MRIKLTHLIGVSLISLTVAFSAINTSEGSRSSSIFGGNTSGGGRTAARIPRFDPDRVYDRTMEECYAQWLAEDCGDPDSEHYNLCRKDLNSELNMCICQTSDDIHPLDRSHACADDWKHRKPKGWRPETFIKKIRRMVPVVAAPKPAVRRSKISPKFRKRLTSGGGSVIGAAKKKSVKMKRRVRTKVRFNRSSRVQRRR